MTGGPMAIGEGVGWRVAGYAVERLVPVEDSRITSVDVWLDYQRWCESGDMVPLAEAVFLEELDTVMREAGIGRQQVGAHVSYAHVGFAGSD